MVVVWEYRGFFSSVMLVWSYMYDHIMATSWPIRRCHIVVIWAIWPKYDKHFDCSKVISRVRDRKSISCFCTNNEKGEVHVAFYDGEERNVTISYLTFAYNTTRCVVQDTGVHFCSFVFKRQDNSDNAKVTRVSKKISDQVLLVMPWCCLLSKRTKWHFNSTH